MFDMQTVINSFPPSIMVQLRPFFYSKGDIIIRKGDKVEYGLFFLSGSYDTIEEDFMGRQFIIAKDQNKVVSLMDIFSDHETQCATIIATTDCTGYKLSRKYCQELLYKPCKFQPYLIKIWAEMFYTTTSNTYRYPIYRTKLKLVMHILANSSEADEGTLKLSIRMESLAAMVGCSRRTLFRVLKELKEEGIIKSTGKIITTDKEKARQYINSAI